MYGRDIRIEFSHCDPAGIVFFPRFFEMLNSQVENFFRDVMAYPFERMILIEKHSVPTVHFQIDFRAPARLGEILRFSLGVARLGRSSVDLRHQAHGPDQSLRLAAVQRLVWVTPEGRSAPWPEPLRSRFAAHLEEET